MLTEIFGQQVKVSWTLPSDNGSPITLYRVYIKESGTETYTLENQECDGTSSSIISDEYCFINISTLVASPFNFNGGESVQAQVIATNFYGDTALASGDGAVYNRVPDKPLNLQEDLTSKTSTTIDLTW